MMKARRRLRDLPLFWKVLIPFVVLLLLIGSLGAFLIVHDLASRASGALDRDLVGLSHDARSIVHDRELYLLESANFASNLDGLSASVHEGSRSRVEQYLSSVVALKSDLDIAAITDAFGKALAEYERTSSGRRRSASTDWSREPFLKEALSSRSRKAAGYASIGGRTLLVIAAPICSRSQPCDASGVAITGIDAQTIAADIQTRLSARTSVALFDAGGRVIGRAGSAATTSVPPDVARYPRRTSKAGRVDVATLWAPFEIQEKPFGTLAVGEPTAAAFAPVRRTAYRLILVIVAAMAGVVAVGALLSRFILGQVKPLVATNRALGEGDLSARAPVLTRDEIGELAAGVNSMAEQLEASVATLEARVAERTEEIRRLLRERTEFFAAMSHELRTPLAIIDEQAQMLVDPTVDRSGKLPVEAGHVIIESTAQLLTFVNDILDLAKAESGRIDVELEELSLVDFVKSLRPTLDGLARGGGLKVKLEIPRDLPRVEADPLRLREIVLNLVDNAVKYTPPGGRISVTAHVHDGRVVVDISDTGIGISPEIGARIFEPFYRVPGVRAQRRRASSGLGLALAKRLALAHGGDLVFTSEPGAGTTFTFTLTGIEPPARAAEPRPRRIPSRV